MPGRSPALIESPESSSPIVTRAVAAGLLGQFFDAYPLRPVEKAALRLLDYFPPAVTRTIVSRVGVIRGLNPALLRDLSIDQVILQRLQDYHPLEGRFPAVITGAALGGVSAVLSLALGGPFVPQAFVASLQGGAPSGDAAAYFHRSAELAQEIARLNPEVLTIQHFDPVHDGYATRFINHLRLKLIGLPQAWQEFVRQRLEPGGALVYLECGAQWLRYRVGERSLFQVGGWGGISAEEFLEGSLRLEHFARSTGLESAGWQLPGYPLETGAESEWGCEPALGQALEHFCRQQDYRFVRISLPEPNDYSRLAFHTIRHLLEMEGRPPAGVLVDIFSQFDSSAVMLAGLLPVWLVYNTVDSLAYLRDMVPAFPREKPIFFSSLITFSPTPDLVPWEDWAEALNGLNWTNLGARPGRYPGDAARLVDWSHPLRKWVSAHRQPIRSRLTVEVLLELVRNSAFSTM